MAKDAIALWGELLVGGGVDAMYGVEWHLATLPDGILAQRSADVIEIDEDAASRGWFVDPTPWANEEFAATSETHLAAFSNGAASGRVDLVTVLMHELGHVLDIPHSDRADSLMQATLGVGERRLPSLFDMPLYLAAGPGPIVTIAQGPAVPAGESPPIDAVYLGSAPDSPDNVGIVNGSFDIADTATAGFAWQVVGEAAVQSGQAVLREGDRFLLGLSQAFLLPDGAQVLRFTLLNAAFADNGGGPADAFELALLDSGMQSLLGAAGLSKTDAALNIQADGSVFAASGVTLRGLGDNGKLDAGESITVDVDLTGIAAGTAATIYFDLIGFGTTGSRVVIDDVQILTAGANTAPVANDDNATVDEDGSFTFDVRVNDDDADGDALAPIVVDGVAHGTLVLNIDGTYTYAPAANYHGDDTFTYLVNDGQADSNLAAVRLTVTAVNDEESLATNAGLTLDEGATASIGPSLLNTTDVDDTAAELVYTVTGSPAHGSVHLSGAIATTFTQADIDAGLVSYRHDGSESASDSFAFTVDDGRGGSARGTFVIAVDPVNDAPVAGDVMIATDEDTAVAIDLMAHVTDAEGDELTLNVIDQPQHGMLVEGPEGTFTYTPTSDYFGSDQFTYRVFDGQAGSNDATVAITVAAVIVPPVIVPVDRQAVNEGTSVDLTVVASDVDNEALVFSLDSAPPGASIDPTTGSFHYAALDGDATHAVVVRVTNSAKPSAFATTGFEIEVADVAPILAISGRAEIDQGTPYTLTISSFDPGADTLTGWTIDWGDGTVDTMAGDARSAQHGYAEPGTLTITATAADEDGSYVANALSVKVIARNLPPVSGDDTATTAEDSAVLIDVLSNDFDKDGDALSIVEVGAPAHGGVVIESGAIRYTPNPNYFGPDSFTYRVSDGTLESNPATVSITVSPVNDPPVPAPIPNQRVLEGQSVSLMLAANDVEGDVLAFSIEQAPAGATIDAASGLFQFAATDGPAMHTVVVRVADDGTPASSATVSFDIEVVNVAPTLTMASEEAEVKVGTPYTLELSSADPGTDTLLGWTIDWGDGTTQTLPGDATGASHTYAVSGKVAIGARATDEDGSYLATPLSLTVTPDLLEVESVTPTASGFNVRFDHAFDASTINLYNDAGGPADLQLVGDLVGPVSGSLLLDADQRGFRFIRSGGILQFDRYSLKLASGPSGFHDTISALDGNGDGTPGDDYLARFDSLSSGAGVLSLPDFMRGPGQPVDVPATGQRLPVSFTSPGGVRNLVFTVDYDPQLLDITGASAGSGLPAGSTVRFESAARDSGGQRARITVILPGDTALAAGSTRLVDLLAQVPASAPYGAKQILDLSVESINGSTVPPGGVADDDAFHLVGYFGDTSGNAAYTTLDGQQIQRVLVKLDPGFAAWANIDPLIIADINGSGSLTSLDASRVLQEVSYLTGATTVDRLEIPPIPTGIGPLTFSGPDPRVDLPIDARAEPGELITVPIRIDTAAGLESVQVRIGYDASRFDLVDVRRGSLTGDFGWFITGQELGRITVDMTRLEALQDGAGTLLDIDLRVRADAAAGVSPIDLQYARLNDDHLTLGVLPQVGADATDGRITVVGKAAPVVSTPLAEAAPVVTTPLADTLSDPQPQMPIPVAADGWPPVPAFGSPSSPVPVIDLVGSFSLPPALNKAIVADSKSKPWLKDYLGNVGQARKASPNAGLKVMVPQLPATKPTSRAVTL